MKIGGFYLCGHGHGPVVNGQECAQCKYDALKTPEEKFAERKVDAEKHLKETLELMKTMTPTPPTPAPSQAAMEQPFSREQLLVLGISHFDLHLHSLESAAKNVLESQRPLSHSQKAVLKNALDHLAETLAKKRPEWPTLPPLDAHTAGLRFELDVERAIRRDAQAQLTAATAEVAALRADGERLDWLARYWDSQCTGLQPLATTKLYPNPDGSYRVAIDAARAKPEDRA